MKIGDDPSISVTSTNSLNKGKEDGKSDKYIVKLKLYRDFTSSTPDLYEFRMSLYYNGEPEDFLLLMRNFNMTLVASGTLDMGAKIQ